MWIRFFFVILLFKLILCAPPKPRLQCKSQELRDIDWFMLYKLPKGVSGPASYDPLLSGVEYLFATSEESFFRFDFVRNITSPDNMLAITLAPLYEQQTKDPNLQWIMYNDQPPDGNNIESSGHSKGVLLFNENEGIWLVHSVPHFPPLPSPETTKYEYPDTGKRYGQSILCISVRKEEFNNIGLQLMYNEIFVYSHELSASTKLLYPNLAAVASQERVKDGSTHRQTEIRSTRGYRFISFAKSAMWNKELYEDLVAPALNKSLYVETWLNEDDKLNSTCDGKYHIQNVESIVFRIDSQQFIFFKNSHDHSKWAIQTENGDNNWVCIGDINRTKSQFTRGGGTVCQNNIFLWRAFRSLVYEALCTRK